MLFDIWVGVSAILTTEPLGVQENTFRFYKLFLAGLQCAFLSVGFHVFVVTGPCAETLNEISKNLVEIRNLAYLSSFFERRVLHIKRIKLITLPAWLFAGSAQFLVWLGASFLPCRDGPHIKIFRAIVEIGEEASLFWFVVLEGPRFLHLLEFDLFAWFGWAWFLFLLLAGASPGIEGFKERFVTFCLVVNAIFQLLDSNAGIVGFLKCWNHAGLLLLLLSSLLCLQGMWVWKLLVLMVRDRLWRDAIFILYFFIFRPCSFTWLRNTHAFLGSNILNFLNNFEFVTQRNAHLLDVLVLELERRLLIFHAIVDELVEIFF